MQPGWFFVNLIQVNTLILRSNVRILGVRNLDRNWATLKSLRVNLSYIFEHAFTENRAFEKLFQFFGSSSYYTWIYLLRTFIDLKIVSEKKTGQKYYGSQFLNGQIFSLLLCFDLSPFVFETEYFELLCLWMVRPNPSNSPCKVLTSKYC